MSSNNRRRRAGRALFAALTVTTLIAGSNALANSGVQLPLNQYQAGSETTSSAPITNANFESADGSGTPTGWTPTSPVMNSGAPDPANPTVPLVTGTRSAQARATGGISPFDNYFLNQTITLAPNTDYVISSYIWNYAFAGPNPPTDLFAGDLAVVQLRDPNNSFNTAGMILEPVTGAGGNGGRGAFMYKTFNSSQFSSGTVQLELSFDPNEDLQFGVNRPELSAQWDNVAITPLSQFSAQRFNNAAGGNYLDGGNWVNGPANQVGAIADFATAATGSPSVVSIASPINLAVLNFKAGGSYRLQGSVINLTHEEPNDAVIINSTAGAHEIASAVQVGVGTMGNPAALVTRNFRVNTAVVGETLTLSGGVSAAAVGSLGTGKYNLNKEGPGQLNLRSAIDVATLNVAAGRVRMIPGNPDRVSVVQNIAVAAAGAPTPQLQLTNQAMVVDYNAGSMSPLTGIKALIVSGYAGGAQTGAGIVAALGNTGGGEVRVGYAERSDLGTVPPVFGTVDSSAVLLRGTLAGDANLDNAVNINDFSALGANFNTPGDWVDGDFNYDGSVNITDFSALAANFNRTTPLAADLPRSAVPEPTSALVAAAIGFLALRRR